MQPIRERDEVCVLQDFELLKQKLINTPILIAPNWEHLFKLKCDVSDVALGSGLNQRKEKVLHSINYPSKTFYASQSNYTVTD